MYSNFKIHSKSHSYSISIGTNEVYSFDLEGRLIWMYSKPHSYQRGLNNQLLLKWRDVKKKHRSLCSENKRKEIYQKLHDVLSQLYLQSTSDSDKAILKQLLKWTPKQLFKDEEHFKSIYQPISILPPDQYTSVVVQAAIGCSYNRCTFCNFYKDRSFYIKDLNEYKNHLEKVKQFLGQGLKFRKSIFLADGDALMIPQARLLNIIELTRKTFPNRDIFSFMDAFRPEAKSLNNYKELKEVGLKRIYIGLETGDPELLQFLEKPGSPEKMKDEVLKFKQAGLNVGVILMLGIGGEQFSNQHIQNSIAILNAMALEKGDIIYFSEFIEHPDQTYYTKARQQGILPLSPEKVKEQFLSIKKGLLFHSKPPQLSLYHLNEYIY